MKKFLLMLVIVAMLIPAAFANGQSETEKEEDLYEIVWYNIGTPQKDTEKVFEELNKYTAEKIGATVKMVYLDWGEFNERTRVIIASGEPYDIIFTCSWANDYMTNVDKGAFLPLNDLLNEHAQGTLDAIDPDFFKGATVDKKIYAVPTNKEMGWWGVWMFNAEIVDKYGFDISNVHKMEDLEPMLKIVKEKEGPDFVPIMCDRQNNYETPEYAYVYNETIPLVVDFDNCDYKIKNRWETPELIRGIDTLRRYYEAGYLPVDAATLNNTEEMRKKKNWFVTGVHSQPYAEKMFERDWKTRMYYSEKYRPYADNASTQGSMQAISVTSERPEKAMMFLNLLNTDPYVRNLVGFGIEGTHWETVANGRIKQLPASQDYLVPGFTLQNLFITHLFENDPADKWEKFDEFNRACRPSPTLGFFFDVAPVKNEIAAVQNVREEFRRFLLTGSVDPVEYRQKFLKALDDAGLETIRVEMQKQLDGWVANK